jgi:hypothetical protein
VVPRILPFQIAAAETEQMKIEPIFVWWPKACTAQEVIAMCLGCGFALAGGIFLAIDVLVWGLSCQLKNLSCSDIVVVTYPCPS